MNKNDDVELYITDVSSEGAGIGRYPADGGFVVFVNGAAAGDRVTAHIIKVKKNYAVGTVKEILEPSPDRTEPDCPYFPSCGGCTFRNITYEAELRRKLSAVKEDFSRLGGIDAEPEGIIHGERTRYRNKAEFPVREQNGRVVIGCFARRSHRVVDCRDCVIQPREFSVIVSVFRDWIARYRVPAYDETSRRGLLRHIYIRRAETTGQIMVCPVINGEVLPHDRELVSALLDAAPGIKTVVCDINREDTNVVLGEKYFAVYGDGYIYDELAGVKVRLSPLSFYQVNRGIAEKLYAKAAEYAGSAPDGVLLDLYCGAGTVGLSMAKNFGRLIGAEIVPQAVVDARVNAGLCGAGNAEFINADAAEVAARLRDSGLEPACVVVDPPRKGLSPGLPAVIASMRPDRVVYISCDPATLARDCAAFALEGYAVRRVCCADMFPGTGHVETVVRLSRSDMNS